MAIHTKYREFQKCRADFFFKKIAWLSASAADQSRIGENIGERGYLLLGEEVAAHLLEHGHLFHHPLHPRHQLRRIRLQPPPPDPVSEERRSGYEGG